MISPPHSHTLSLSLTPPRLTPSLLAHPLTAHTPHRGDLVIVVNVDHVDIGPELVHRELLDQLLLHVGRRHIDLAQRNLVPDTGGANGRERRAWAGAGRGDEEQKKYTTKGTENGTKREIRVGRSHFVVRLCKVGDMWGCQRCGLGL